jgi:hypothetical protein
LPPAAAPPVWQMKWDRDNRITPPPIGMRWGNPD